MSILSLTSNPKVEVYETDIEFVDEFHIYNNEKLPKGEQWQIIGEFKQEGEKILLASGFETHSEAITWLRDLKTAKGLI